MRNVYYFIILSCSLFPFCGYIVNWPFNSDNTNLRKEKEKFLNATIKNHFLALYLAYNRLIFSTVILRFQNTVQKEKISVIELKMKKRKGTRQRRRGDF
jgi:hypothetical protein